jgi:hypothetical protein
MIDKTVETLFNIYARQHASFDVHYNRVYSGEKVPDMHIDFFIDHRIDNIRSVAADSFDRGFTIGFNDGESYGADGDMFALYPNTWYRKEFVCEMYSSESNTQDYANTILFQKEKAYNAGYVAGFNYGCLCFMEGALIHNYKNYIADDKNTITLRHEQPYTRSDIIPEDRILLTLMDYETLNLSEDDIKIYIRNFKEGVMEGSRYRNDGYQFGLKAYRSSNPNAWNDCYSYYIDFDPCAFPFFGKSEYSFMGFFLGFCVGHKYSFDEDYNFGYNNCS